MQQQVALVEDRKQVAILVDERIDGLEWWIAQRLDTRHVDEPCQHPQVERRRQRVDSLRLQRELALERASQIGGSHLLDFEAHDIASPPSFDFPLDDLELRMSALVV